MTIFISMVAHGVRIFSCDQQACKGKCKHVLRLGRDCKGVLVQGYLCEHCRHLPMTMFTLMVADGVCSFGCRVTSKHLWGNACRFGSDCKRMLVQAYLCECYRHTPNDHSHVYGCRWSLQFRMPHDQRARIGKCKHSLLFGNDCERMLVQG